MSRHASITRPKQQSIVYVNGLRLRKRSMLLGTCSFSIRRQNRGSGLYQSTGSPSVSSNQGNMPCM